MLTFVIAATAGIAVAALIGAVLTAFRNPAESLAESRLDLLAGKSNASLSALAAKEQSVLSRPLDDVPNAIEELVSRFLDLRLLLDQAAVPLTPAKFAGISCGLAAVGFLAGSAFRIPIWASSLVSITLFALPYAGAVLKRGMRLKKFTTQLPEALDLVGRALRAGHSLGSGFQLVAAEIPEPLGSEFGRVYEEQNLGVSLEGALENMCNRVPNLDLRFFATAVVLQRQTGGDLAEILDKIGSLIRERFKIWGQIQSLTGEGRISGVVLMGLPPLLMGAMWRLNPDYIALLFTDPLGKKMLGVAIGLQVLGALVIKKIVNIKV